jgi:hypothetical protein
MMLKSLLPVVCAVTLAGCAENAPPQMQVLYVCPAGYYLVEGNLCWPVAPPPARYADTSPGYDDPPASQPAPPPPKASEPTWMHDLKTAGAGAAIGAIAGNQLAKRGAAEAVAGEVGGAEAGAALGEAGAGAATVATEDAVVGGGFLEGAEVGEVLLGIGEIAIELLPFGISSHQSWHGIVRHPVYVVPKPRASVL